jgi:CubicO group peptidase (beta-lactamase class C family)
MVSATKAAQSIDNTAGSLSFIVTNNAHSLFIPSRAAARLSSIIRSVLHRLLLRLVAFLAVLAIVLTGRTANPAGSATVWVATSDEGKRLARVEATLPPLEAEGHTRPMDVAAWMALYDAPGLSVAVWDDFKLVWAKAYGVKAAGGGEPVTLDTLFQAGSISKPVSAIAALQQVERGALSLDADINTVLRSWKVPENELTAKEKVTLRRLLSHRAGLTVHGFPGYAVNEPEPTLVQVLDGAPPANTAPVRVDLVPGTKFRYSGGGTTIVQLALQEVLGRPFPDIMRDAVIDRLALKNSTFEQPLTAARAAQAATGHRSSGRAVEGRWHVYPEMAAAGLWTTPSDLAAIAIEVARTKKGESTRLLKQATVIEMLTPASRDESDDQTPGLGFFVDRTGKTDRFGHGGSDEGFQAMLMAFAATGRGAAVMVNSDNGIAAALPLFDAIAREYQWPGYEPWKPGIRPQLTAARKHGGVDAVIAEYRHLHASHPATDFDPGQLNSFGYELLRSGDRDGAIRVLTLNVEMYPSDANAYDSLGEAYMEAGQKELAIKSFRRSLELDSKNDHAVAMLKKLGADGAK